MSVPVDKTWENRCPAEVVHVALREQRRELNRRANGGNLPRSHYYGALLDSLSCRARDYYICD